ncbi:MAG: pyruvate dehydrogenase complex dihydrolipoamide acetyltransferase [Spirochaetaceae bacterium]|nr:MAG: pyruvate dehydrogenase complex dihydrolipoamide acetyltransferase [Spirochaetaceae bacterium]
MAEKVLMTALSPTMEEGTIVAWRKKEGDSVSSGDVLCEVETDKATMDYEATQEGVLLKIIRGEGSSSSVGQTIAILGDKGEDVSSIVEEAKAEGSSSADGSEAEETAAAPEAKEAGAGKSADDREAGQSGHDVSSGGPVKSSPLARKIAADRGIDIAQVSGSGPGGRVVKADVESFSPRSAGTAASSAPRTVAAGEDQKIPVSGKRAVIARRLAESKFSAPHYYLKSSVKMDGAMAARTQLNKELADKAGFNAFLMKFVAEALKRHPDVNAGWQGDHIMQYGSIDIGLAVDLGNGLITPIVRNCGNKGVVAIDDELKVLIKKAGDGKLSPEEYTGATFTISNLGSFGIEEFTAIINPPGAAILAVGSIAKSVVVNDQDEIDVAQVMKMTLSCDHRVIDGAAGGRFLFELKQIIENPVRVLF